MISAAQLLLSIFLSDLLPVFVIAGVGFLLARYAGVQVQTVSRLTFHALAPAFVFNTLVNSTAESSQIGRMTLFYLLVAISAATMARIAAIPFRLDRRALSAFMLVVVCSNSGNYGLPVTLLAFGREALTFASVYFVASSIFSYTGGVLLAASGRRSLSRRDRRNRARASGVRRDGGGVDAQPRDPPSRRRHRADYPSQRSGDADDDSRARDAARAGVTAGTPRSGRSGGTVSLILTPLAALGIAHLIGLQGAALQAGVLQTSMPTAVITTILAVEFDVVPDFVTSVVFVSTLLSPLTVTLMIAYLQTVG